MLILSCKREQKIEASSLNYFPPNASAILQINHPNAFKSELKNNDFLEKVKTTSLFATIRNKMIALDLDLISRNTLFAFYTIGKNDHDFILLHASDTIPLNFDNAKTKKIETFSYENKSVTEYQINENRYFGTTMRDKYILSSSLLLLENTIRTNGKNQVSKTLQRLVDTADPIKPASLFFNLESESLLSDELIDFHTVNLSSFASWLSADFITEHNELLLSGVVISNDSTSKFIDLFRGTIPLSNQTAMIAPQGTDALLGFSFNDYDQFLSNQKRFMHAANFANDVVKNIEEIGIIFLGNEKAVAIHTFDSAGIMEVFQRSRIGSSNYQGSEIIKMHESDLIEKLFKPLVKNFDSKFYTVFENTFVFAANQNILQTIIANKRSGITFDQSPIYQSTTSKIGSESSLLFVSGNKGLHYFLDNHFKPNLAAEFKQLKLDDLGFATQLIADTDFLHFNVSITKIKATFSENTVAPIYNLELDRDLITHPQFVKNHRNDRYEIVVQDRDNYLYLISTKGKVLWKKQLQGKIQGKIHQVDLYKNGKLQLAFCTNNQFLILDRNGKEVPPFTKKYQGGNLNPLAVFDYENNRNYRFVVTQGKNIFMYNANGKLVKEFSYKEAKSAIIKAPKHFRIGSKDYLVFQLENGQLKIHHRSGRERIKVNRTLSFSDNAVFLYKNKFSVTDKKGVLHQIDTQGKLSATNFNLTEDHGMFATNNTLALMNDNILSIRGKKIILDLGVYTPPKIFYINNKIYVSVTDIQNQKVYLYDSQAKPLANFPIYGSSVIDLIDMDNDKKLELVTKDQENSIIVYRMN